MAQKKKVRIPYPSSFTQEEMEKWFAAKAAEGLAVFHTGDGSALFEKGRPCIREYRLMPMDPGGPKGPKEQAEVYREAGWQYVSNIRRMVLLLQREGRYSVDLYLAEKDEMCALLQKKLKGQMLGVWFSYLIYLVWFWFICWMNRAGLLLLAVQGMLGLIFLVMGSCGLIQLASQRHIRRLHRLIGSMISGRKDGDQEKGRGSAPALWAERALAALFLLLAAVGGTSMLLSAVTCRRTVLEGRIAGTEALSILPLSELEEEDGMEFSRNLYLNGKERRSVTVSRWRPFTSRTVEVTQYGSLDSGEKGTMNSTLILEYYELAAPGFLSGEGLSYRLLDELRRKHIRGPGQLKTQEVESGFFDALYIHDAGLQYLFACRGNQVLYASYGGGGNLAEHIDAFEEAFRRLERE